ncbi:MAG: CoA transferase, partial [Pseudomonadales bacterium]|nr:CoA transferase [Pseudomonadales bacterium]
MSRASRRVLHTALSQLSAATGHPDFTGIGFRAGQHAFNSPFRSAEAASAALLAGASIASSIGAARHQQTAGVELSSRHAEASLLSFLYLRFSDPGRAPAARIAPEDRTAAAGFFRARDDRWVYLHPGFPHNTEGLLKLLGTPDNREAVTARIREISAATLEDQMAAAGLCGAMVRAPEEWDISVPGRLLRSQPVVEIIQIGE